MKKTSKRTLFTRLVLFFNYLVIFGILASYMAAMVSPKQFWVFAFLGLSYPIWLILNLIFVLFWAIRLKYYFLFSLIAIVLGYSHISTFIQFPKSSNISPVGVSDSLHILSYNVKSFDLYNYGPKWELNFENRNHIFEYIKTYNFDIMCFQEFVHDSSGKFKTLDTLSNFTNAKYVHVYYTRSSRKENHFGLATYSKYPIINKGVIPFRSRGGNSCIFSDIKLNEDTIRIYNVHLSSVGLGKEDYIYIENVINAETLNNREELKRGGMRILRGLKRAFEERADQVHLIKNHIKDCPYPIVLAGDFNDTPTSYAYRILTQNLKDSFYAGSGMGQTYAGILPGIRIDYILHSQDFVPHRFKTGKEKYSDHFPIQTHLYLLDK